MAVSLKNGYIQGEVHYPDRDPIVITTNEKYNTGTRQHIEITKSYSKGTDTFLLNSQRESKMNVPHTSIIRIKDVPFMYFGGIPPQYSLQPSLSSCVPSHTQKGLLGTIESISPTGGGKILLTNGPYFGLHRSEEKVSISALIFLILLFYFRYLW